MVVEELQILVGCDASTAEKVLTELETRLNRFVKQSASSMQNAKAIRAQATAEKEALKTEAARVKYANGIAKLNLALEAAQRKAAQAAEKLNEKMRKIFASASKQSNAFEQMADGQCESLNKVAETAEEVERRLDEAMNRTPNGWGKKRMHEWILMPRLLSKATTGLLQTVIWQRNLSRKRILPSCST